MMRIYTVSEFRQELNELLGEVNVIIRGEISGFHVAHNRFVWFNLIDDSSVLPCFIMAFQLHQSLEDGMVIEALGSATIFKSGKFVFKPRQIKIVGEGSLQRAFELLRQKLTKEGLFDKERKRPLPRFPQAIGLIASRDSAAYTDVLRILNNRWSGLTICHCNVQVQGDSAVGEIINALRQINEDYPHCEVIILVRGGGSLEDLQPFNTEKTVRAIFASTIPVISGVGHERDVTLTDLVADARASTPTNAAEMVVPDRRDVITEIDFLRHRLDRHCERTLANYAERILQLIQQLENFYTRRQLRFTQLEQNIILSLERLLHKKNVYAERLHYLTDLFKSYNPTNVLKRGYTITYAETGKILSSIKQVQRGEKLVTAFRDGRAESTVDTIN